MCLGIILACYLAQLGFQRPRAKSILRYMEVIRELRNRFQISSFVRIKHREPSVPIKHMGHVSCAGT